MKTAVTVLQEMMVKLNQTPEYECVSQTGPQHSATFEYRCAARGCEVRATARSKKEAKQEAARCMLAALAARGHPVPPPYAPRAAQQDEASGGGAGAAAAEAMGARSYVALLKDLCEEYRLAGTEYELVGDTGPPHMRQFTVRARLSGHARLATASTKKAARQLAAQQLYTYLRENLARLTKDFVEEEALVRAHERAMQRYVEVRAGAGAGAWRPDLGQRVAQYHRGLVALVDEEQRERALEALRDVTWCEAEAEGDGAEDGERAEQVERAVEAAASALALSVRVSALAGARGELTLLELSPSLPEIVLAGRTRAQAYAQAARYLRMALAAPAPPPDEARAPAPADCALQLRDSPLVRSQF